MKLSVKQDIYWPRCFQSSCLTGGEPLVRARIDDLAPRYCSTPGLYDLSVSTNGTRLKQFAAKLRDSGVQRLNVSLDTLSPGRFQALTRRDGLQDVLSGLEVARVWIPPN